MIQRIILALLICVTMASCDKPKPYKGDTKQSEKTTRIPVVIVNDMGEEEVVEESNDATPPDNSAEPTLPSDTTTDTQCCKICKSSIPCGDSCISSTKTCSKGSGCACNADGTKP